MSQDEPSSRAIELMQRQAPDMHQSLVALKARLATSTDIDVLKHALGLQSLANIPVISEAIVDDMVVVCLDCEHWSDNTDEMTEIGVVHFTMGEMAKITKPEGRVADLGNHGEYMLRAMKVNPLRIKENSHLVSGYAKTRGAAGNRFGEWRFTSFGEAREILRQVFEQLSEYGNCKRPVVLLGHDVVHDRNNLKGKQINFDLEALGTVVRVIDTQVMAREGKYWHHRTNQIGLARLARNLRVQHKGRDPHTAANDAARTLICAIQLALGHHPCKGSSSMTMQQVAKATELYSRITFESLGGDSVYCCKCGSCSHLASCCTGTIKPCDPCITAGRTETAGIHISTHCLWVAHARKLARRERDKASKAQRDRAKAERKAAANQLKREAKLQLRSSATAATAPPSTNATIAANVSMNNSVVHDSSAIATSRSAEDAANQESATSSCNHLNSSNRSVRQDSYPYQQRPSLPSTQQQVPGPQAEPSLRPTSQQDLRPNTTDH
ncbi:hypothetical protein NX059_011348 [Plenodomus lindquistii]|nr:hypothetical protein NX059_011348 [Plenodomus lindquistii]